jgi:hypothetical protein
VNETSPTDTGRRPGHAWEAVAVILPTLSAVSLLVTWTYCHAFAGTLNINLGELGLDPQDLLLWSLACVPILIVVFIVFWTTFTALFYIPSAIAVKIVRRVRRTRLAASVNVPWHNLLARLCTIFAAILLLVFLEVLDVPDAGYPFAVVLGWMPIFIGMLVALELYLLNTRDDVYVALPTPKRRRVKTVLIGLLGLILSATIFNLRSVDRAAEGTAAYVLFGRHVSGHLEIIPIRKVLVVDDNHPQLVHRCLFMIGNQHGSYVVLLDAFGIIWRVSTNNLLLTTQSQVFIYEGFQQPCYLGQTIDSHP